MWTPTRQVNTCKTTFLTIDDYLQYTPFFSDFGPFNIADIFRFCCLLKERLELNRKNGKLLCLYTKPEDEKRANAAFAICCYMMLLHNMSPEETYAPLESVYPPITSYCDASYGPSTFTLTILDCLHGLRKALDLGLLQLDRFDLKEYEHYEQVRNGDFNWITPFFIAFAGPKDRTTYEALTKNSGPGEAAVHLTKSFQNILDYFEAHNVQCIVRLNNKTYDETHFRKRGMDHIDLIYPDGTCPSWYIVEEFLNICESVIMDQSQAKTRLQEQRQHLCSSTGKVKQAHESDGTASLSHDESRNRGIGVIAVHCMAGLGRTGTLIAVFLMRHFDMSAREAIAFLRLMRPGSVPEERYQHLQIWHVWL
ncbi:dual specificity protein phosphatase [Lobosporangium transversale]|uniref:Dual specificity protein phosphatase n=1 Tax=Lobosporangium transversale TaxID=64571 RepID=A0A1Y2GZF9_9FUNG|nr:dual specificity protein phosphatase [Lobosporangium transversale]ORZ27689.1 dual specificity protein phosphatase [Lobosporangium transversale]|eukprot:XP_021885392.1 dual specificity protein phosphatase [Lobosporangium transversale]